MLKILTKHFYRKKEDFQKNTEYRDLYDGERLYSNMAQTGVYVSKRANDESAFWKGGKFCYENVHIIFDKK